MSTASSAATWSEFASASPDLAERVQKRFDSHRHAVMATIRADGSPRMSGMEAPIRDGHLWLGMEYESTKAGDLRRDPRFGLHSAPDDEAMTCGDARIEGHAVPADSELATLFARGHRFEIDDPTRIALFTAEITRVVLVHVAEHALLVESWSPAGGLASHRLAGVSA
ncbi:pyridoxamine 5'-phosphate oxidase family protein [Candidatus Poriferisodalis sp.]|uniref:pyridoxamine 5'-phosphate oxidase family protein n=1 Tax=Candidatus Poriferisodalis sp. TaxID=3101277 RepID=UPI003B01C257